MAAWACTLGLAALALPAQAAGFPAAYEPLVLRPSGLPERAEFDLSAALERARREHKRLYVYLGADDCRYCRRYEAFLEHTRVSWRRTSRPTGWWWICAPRCRCAPTRCSCASTGGAVRSPSSSRDIGDERGNVLVYPNVWVLDGRARPLMQMPMGTGTFQTVPEQLEILRLDR